MSTAGVTARRVPDTAAPAAGPGRRDRSFAVVFALDLWERFSFFGLATILVLYLVAPVGEGGAGLPAVDAAAVFGAYMSLGFLAGLPGGWLTDRLLGPRRAAIAGGALVAAGHLTLAVPATAATYVGLLCVAGGTGLVKPATAALAALTRGGRANTQATFSLFYLAIQVSALLAPLVVGTVAERVGWHAGFAVAGAGMVTGLVWFVVGTRGGGTERTAHRMSPAVRRGCVRWAVVLVVVVVTVALLAANRLVTAQQVLIPPGLSTLAAPAAFVAHLLRGERITGPDRRRTIGLVILLAASSCFWMIFAQDTSVLGVFARNDVDREVGGWLVPAAWFQSLHPLFVLLLAPLSAWWWGRRSRSPRTLGFAVALALAGGSFVLVAAAGRGPVSPWWLVGAYLLQAGGEIVVGPVGLALAARLAPPGRRGQFLGLYGLFAAFGVVSGNQLYRLTGVLPLPLYFLLCGLAVVVVAVLLAAVSPRVDRLLQAGGTAA
ncbi:peptide MFS transporter [Micromonospora soli]|uniref:peptide MFS transporter n=1 Tax=Micromonospora sp. NBRC 110009 TaxID=3061627 RepID=UPI002671B563|nr:peptide MFS transporter [Micromonospora sp. NBRC 110009]WKU00428.1 peptide MFS transporter [Micromonospora sp. NBRC 110009]